MSPEVVNLIGQLGFPIVVAGFLLWRLDPTLNKLKDAIDQVKTSADVRDQAMAQRDVAMLAALTRLADKINDCPLKSADQGNVRALFEAHPTTQTGS